MSLHVLLKKKKKKKLNFRIIIESLRCVRRGVEISSLEHQIYWSFIQLFSFMHLHRQQRCLMVQTEDQYVFIHFALLDYMESGETEVDANELRDYIRKHMQTEQKTGMNLVWCYSRFLSSIYLYHYLKHLTISCSKIISILIISISTISIWKHITISNISLSQTSIYLKHLFISNISLSQTSIYLKHLYRKYLYISNTSLSRTSLNWNHEIINSYPSLELSFKYICFKKFQYSS